MLKKEKSFVPQDEEALKDALSHLQDFLWEEKGKMNLDQAEKYLAQVSQNSSIHEVVKGKLYYSILKEGKGIPLHKNSEPLVDYSLSLLDNNGNKKLVSKENALQVKMQTTITGFQIGVSGMNRAKKEKFLFILVLVMEV